MLTESIIARASNGDIVTRGGGPSLQISDLFCRVQNKLVMLRTAVIRKINTYVQAFSRLVVKFNNVSVSCECFSVKNLDRSRKTVFDGSKFDSKDATNPDSYHQSNAENRGFHGVMTIGTFGLFSQ